MFVARMNGRIWRKTIGGPSLPRRSCVMSEFLERTGGRCKLLLIATLAYIKYNSHISSAILNRKGT
jgi:hypothetical protein